ncbi:hypothetical protein [Tsuneonella amylolytica]|uniref:hypothetical protein n=1 Tax=Tsuneonella amylolytica TaxID=2338327 RepID=UPI000EA84E92|nr:hypothetical protein [Tsuneonella amylolytica]
MFRNPRLALLSGALALAACQQQAQSAGNIVGEETASVAGSTVNRPSPAPTLPPMTDPEPTGTNPSKADPYAGTNDGYPDLAPSPTVPDKAKTETGARAVLLSWARGIELREFDQSWEMMGEAARSQTSKAAFNAMFAPLHDIVVAVPGGQMEGAAGSSYYTVPTTVTGTARDGSKKTYSGEVVLRRVNDVLGATPEELAWHIERVNLR